MPTLAALALAASIPLVPAQSGDPAVPANLDFEEVEANGTPTAWTSSLNGPAPELVAPSAETPERRGLHLRFRNDGTSVETLNQYFDPRPYRGQVVRLSGRVRVESERYAGAAYMYLRLWGAGDLQLFDEDMEDAPVLAGGWREVRFEALVPDHARMLDLGLMLLGEGEAWWDELRFEAFDFEPEPPRPLTAMALENARAFARLLGYVRHFHPSDGAAAQDWERFAACGLRRVEGCGGPAELAATLRALFQPIAPTVQVYERGAAPPLPAALARPEEIAPPRLAAWRHHGYGHEGGALYTSQRPLEPAPAGELPEGFSDPAAPYEAELAGGLACRVPLALWADEDGTLPRDSGPLALDTALVVEDRATRLAAVVLGWNVLQHFYPYFDVVETDWDAALTEALRGAAEADGVEAMRLVLERLLAHLRDGHGRVQSVREWRAGYLPLRWEWIDGRLIVTGSFSETLGGAPRPGDEVLEIDGVDVAELLAREEAFVSAAHDDARRDRALRRLLRGVQRRSVELLLETPRGERRTALMTHHLDRRLPEPRPDVVEELEPGIWYVDLDRATEDVVADLPDLLADARGIVFDLRGYPRAHFLVGHLTDEVMLSPFWEVPEPGGPDRTDLTWSESGWPVAPARPRFTAPTVFLAGSSTQSAAETYLSFVEQYRLAEIVGEPTAGTNGNVNPFRVPGGFTLSWTGMRVRKQDGSRHHGVGILPTVPVAPTREGAIDGRDEVLEEGLALVRAAIAAGRGAGVLPRTAADFCARAEDLLEDDDPEGALEAAERALALDPGFIAARSWRGLALLFMDRFEEAAAELARVTEAQPESLPDRALLAVARHGAGDLEGARAEVEAVLAQEPEHPQALATSGWIELDAGELDRALARFDAALELDRRNARAAFGRVGVRYARGEWEAALEDVELAERALRREGSLAPLHEWHLRRRLGEESRARFALESALRRWDEGDLAWFPPLADLALGRIEEKELLFRLESDRAWEAPHARAEASFWIGLRALEEGDLERARELFRLCVEEGRRGELSGVCARAELERLR